MVLATPNPVNDAELNAQLDITRDASIANLRQKSDEVQTQYRDEAARIEDQKKTSAAVVQSAIDAARDNRAVTAEENFKQALANTQAVEAAVFQNAPAEVLNYNRLSGIPLHLHADVIKSTQELMRARDEYIATHPEEKDNPALQVYIGDDGLAKYGTQAELEQQSAIASLDDARNLPLDDLRKVVQRPQRQNRTVDPNKPLASLVDQSDGSFDLVLQTGEIFKGFKGTENREAIRKLGESKVQTRRHYESLAQQLPQPQQPANGQQPAPQPQAQPANGAVNENQSLTDWFLDETAKRFGYTNGAEMVADQKQRYQREQQNQPVIDLVNNQNIVSQFFTEHPDYPQTQKADDAIEAIINRNGWEWTPDAMAAAHALAVQTRIYQPLTQEEIAAANGFTPPAQRHAPPPMLQSGNPENTRPTEDLYSMPLDQLRKQALAAQTGGR